VQTARRLAECPRKWRLRQETSDGRLLTDGTMRDVQLQRERRPQTRRRPGRLDTGCELAKIAKRCRRRRGPERGGGEVMRDVYPLAPRVKSRSGIFSCIGHIFNIIANCEKGGSG